MSVLKRPGKRPFLADALAAALFLGGCLTNQTSDQPGDLNGETSLLTQEVDDMGKVSVAAALLKAAVPAAAASSAASDSADVSLTPLKFDAVCQCHVRSISIKTEAGFSRERIDSVYFIDAGDKYLRFPTLERVKTVLHKRWVRQSRSGREAEIHIVTGMLLNPGSPDTTGTWNGEISGSYAGQAYREGKITSVVRKLKDRRWQFPESGKLEVKGEILSLKLTYLGGGSAQAVRTDAQTGKSVTITVDSTYRERL